MSIASGSAASVPKSGVRETLSSKTVLIEAVDPVFQTKMLDMLKQTGRPEMVVGWYHSHPGFGCWLSGVDINTQQVGALGQSATNDVDRASENLDYSRHCNIRRKM